MLGAIVEHLLGFLDAADQRAGEAMALEDQVEGGDRQRLLGGADQHHGGVAFEQRQIGVEIVAGRNGVENEIEAVEVAVHLVAVFRDDHLVSAETLGVGGLGR